jgi:UDP-N-acetylmuramate--alanine ligase
MRPLGSVKNIHFVGIGGIGMSGIAELLLTLGYQVSGSDLKESTATLRLRELGARIHIGHNASNLEEPDVVVYSSAVPPENVELLEADKRGIPVIKRAEVLAEFMRLKYGIAVAGAHGKTTTTSMVASVLTHGGLDPTVILGGRLNVWGGSNARLGEGDILVAEADESDGSFLLLYPTLAVVTNIDREHMDHYRSMDALRNSFLEFVNRIPFYGKAFVCLDDPELQHILPKIRKKYLTYGFSSQADLRASELLMEGQKVSFNVNLRDYEYGRVEVGMPGEHNVRNALAAIAVGLELNIPFEHIKSGLRDLGGLARRFQIKGERDGILVLDDYGHHPTEIECVLKTAKQCWPDRRLVVLFQPHRFTRTYDLLEHFSVAFYDCDLLFVFPIYSAGESPIGGIDHHLLAKEIRKHGHKEVYSMDRLEAKAIIEMLKKGDVVLTLGAGDIYKLGEQILAEL